MIPVRGVRGDRKVPKVTVKHFSNILLERSTRQIQFSASLLFRMYGCLLKELAISVIALAGLLTWLALFIIEIIWGLNPLLQTLSITIWIIFILI